MRIRKLFGQVVLASLVLAPLLSSGFPVLAAESYATQYFLDEPPSDLDLSRIPSTADDVIVAKGRIDSLAYLIGRDQSGEPPPLPKELFYARIRVRDVLRGTPQGGATLDVYFGIPGGGRKNAYPASERMKGREYFVISYVDADRMRRLVGVPMSVDAYNEWETERHAK